MHVQGFKNYDIRQVISNYYYVMYVLHCSQYLYLTLESHYCSNYICIMFKCAIKLLIILFWQLSWPLYFCSSVNIHRMLQPCLLSWCPWWSSCPSSSWCPCSLWCPGEWWPPPWDPWPSWCSVWTYKEKDYYWLAITAADRDSKQQHDHCLEFEEKLSSYSNGIWLCKDWILIIFYTWGSY